MSGGDHEVGRWKWLLLLSGLWLPTLLSGCAEGSPEVDSAESSRIVAVGAPAAAALRQGLVTRLTAAMEEGGPVGAIDFCSTEAIPLTLATQSGLHEGLTLKRTSFRYRNPANAPDEAEEAALLYFERSLQGISEFPPSSPNGSRMKRFGTMSRSSRVSSASSAMESPTSWILRSGLCWLRSIRATWPPGTAREIFGA